LLKCSDISVFFKKQIVFYAKFSLTTQIFLASSQRAFIFRKRAKELLVLEFAL
jgi:hypothetical protein